MFCANCGASVPDDGGFCPECGASIEIPAVEEAVPAVPAVDTTPLPTAPPVPAVDTMPLPTAPPVPAADTMPLPTAAPYPLVGDMPPQGGPAFYPQQMAPAVAPVPAKPKKKSKKWIFIVIGAVVLVALLVVGGIVGYGMYQSNNYDKAMEMLKSGDYQGAYDAFGDLGDYEDSASQQALAQRNMDYLAAVALFDGEKYEEALKAFEALNSFKDSATYVEDCQLNLDYLAAVALFDDGDFEAALSAFIALSLVDFSDASDWVDKTNYAIADKMYKDGDKYGAYKAFRALGSYKDSKDRMKKCTTKFPKTKEIYHNDKYVSSRSAIAIDATNAVYVSYFKIYSGKTLVSTMWINEGGSLTIELPPGKYSIKQATGFTWFGEDIMFGDEGLYEVMIFSNNSKTYDLKDNIIVTITLAATEGNMGAENTSRDDF